MSAPYRMVPEKAKKSCNAVPGKVHGSARNSAAWSLGQREWLKSVACPKAWSTVLPPAKWSFSSTVTTNNVFCFVIPSWRRRLKNVANAWSYSCSVWT